MSCIASGFLLSAQPFRPEITGFDGKNFVTFLDRTGLVPSPWGCTGRPLILIEDRDKFSIGRGVRFTAQAIEDALSAATSIVVVLYRRPGQMERLGQEMRFREHVAIAQTALASPGVRVFVKTTNDRLTFWAQLARAHAPSNHVFRYTDADGAARITAEWGECA